MAKKIQNSYIALLKKTKSEIQQDKLIEGCCVLSSILMQQRNHPHRNLTVEVEDGLASVLLWADLISLGYDEERINKRIANKLKKHKKIL